MAAFEYRQAEEIRDVFVIYSSKNRLKMAAPLLPL
jgi:hypothetical protein